MNELIKATEENVKVYKKIGKIIQERYGVNLANMILSKSVYGCVYFIKDNVNGNVKIGTTKNIQRRIKQISNNNDDLEVIKVLDVPLTYSINIKFEKFLHNHFKEYRKRGEWFSGCVIDLIDKDFEETCIRKIIKDITYEAVIKVLKKQQNLSLLKEIMNFINESIEKDTKGLDVLEEIDLKEDEVFKELLCVVNKLDIEKINEEFKSINDSIYKATKDSRYYPLFNSNFYI